MPTASSLLDAILEAWDRHQATVLGLLSVIPPDGLTARVMPGSPTVAAMFAHLHYERMCSLKENTPECAGAIPDTQWNADADGTSLRLMLADSGQRLRRAVQARIEADRPLDQDFPHPLTLLQFLVFHESYHHGQIKLALKAAGMALDDEVVGPVSWDVWRARDGWQRDIDTGRLTTA
jgi:uncharacterized damage-inducible protein DinB